MTFGAARRDIHRHWLLANPFDEPLKLWIAAEGVDVAEVRFEVAIVEDRVDLLVARAAQFDTVFGLAAAFARGEMVQAFRGCQRRVR